MLVSCCAALKKCQTSLGRFALPFFNQSLFPSFTGPLHHFGLGRRCSGSGGDGLAHFGFANLYTVRYILPCPGPSWPTPSRPTTYQTCTHLPSRASCSGIGSTPVFPYRVLFQHTHTHTHFHHWKVYPYCTHSIVTVYRAFLRTTVVFRVFSRWGVPFQK